MTRTIDPESFRQSGILPLKQTIEALWSMVFDLLDAQHSEREKRAFRRHVEAGTAGHDGQLYRMKVTDRLHWGPYGILVRDAAFQAATLRKHDYFRTPEIVEDICNCYELRYGRNLLDAFQSRSVPCVVMFAGDSSRRDVLPTALMYLWTVVHRSGHYHFSNTCFDGQGCPVPPQRILSVEPVAAT